MTSVAFAVLKILYNHILADATTAGVSKMHKFVLGNITFIFDVLSEI